MDLGLNLDLDRQSKLVTEPFNPLLTPDFWYWMQDPTNVTIVGPASAPTSFSQTNKLGGAMGRREQTLGIPTFDRTLGGKTVCNFVRASNNKLWMHGYDTDIANTANWTMLLMFQTDLATQDGQCLFMGMQGGSNNFGWRYENFGGVGVSFRNNGITANNKVPVNGGAGDTLPHVLWARRTGGSLEIGIDGSKQIVTGTVTNMVISNGYLYGRDEGAGGRDHLDGTVPDHRIFKRSLTYAEINNHAKDMAANYPAAGTPAWVNLT